MAARFGSQVWQPSLAAKSKTDSALRLKEACSLTNWAIISMSPQNKMDAKAFYNEIVREAQNFGIKVDSPKHVHYITPERKL